MLKILDSENKISLNDINEIENQIGLSIPNNFKKFILKYNGGYIEEHDYIDTLLSIKYGKITIEYFIKLHTQIEKNLPVNFLPIALDWSNNPIAIDLQKNDIVLFYFDEDSERKIIANSLEELLGVESIDEL
ncbi:SMI1/KNR4 family protein [Flavobacterium sp.]|uniref:SMI1/KNR4 family protein n=1 Tax=Flavobacterium sp. TaxID=239 RepID=UPI0039E2B050